MRHLLTSFFVATSIIYSSNIKSRSFLDFAHKKRLLSWLPKEAFCSIIFTESIAFEETLVNPPRLNHGRLCYILSFSFKSRIPSTTALTRCVFMASAHFCMSSISLFDIRNPTFSVLGLSVGRPIFFFSTVITS